MGIIKMTERELYREAIIKSNWMDKYSFDNYYFITDGKYVPLLRDDKELADWLNIGWDMWQASANRDGYKLVPVEPTPKMIDATWDNQEEIESMSHNARNEFIYKSMLNKA